VIPHNTNGQHSILVATGWLYATVSFAHLSNLRFINEGICEVHMLHDLM